MTKHAEWQVVGGKKRLIVSLGDSPKSGKKQLYSKENPPPHGDHLRYYGYGCRCDPCTASATAYARHRRHEAYETTDYTDPAFKHGSAHSYSNLGCRCELCKTAMRAHQRKYPESQERKAARNAARRRKRQLIKLKVSA